MYICQVTGAVVPARTKSRRLVTRIRMRDDGSSEIAEEKMVSPEYHTLHCNDVPQVEAAIKQARYQPHKRERNFQRRPSKFE